MTEEEKQRFERMRSLEKKINDLIEETEKTKGMVKFEVWQSVFGVLASMFGGAPPDIKKKLIEYTIYLLNQAGIVQAAPVSQEEMNALRKKNVEEALLN